jgi:HEAT repeat protein
MQDTGAVEALTGLLKDEVKQTREAAATALAEIRKSAGALQ